MIHPEVKRLLQEVFGSLSEKEGRSAGEYPEVYLLSLLENIKEKMPEVSAMLYSTVEMGAFDDSLEEASKRLGLQTIQSTKPQHRRITKKHIKKLRPEKIVA